MRKSFALELREEWSEPVDECIGLKATADDPKRQRLVNSTRLSWSHSA